MVSSPNSACPSEDPLIESQASPHAAAGVAGEIGGCSRCAAHDERRRPPDRMLPMLLRLLMTLHARCTPVFLPSCLLRSAISARGWYLHRSNATDVRQAVRARRVEGQERPVQGLRA